MNGYIGFVFIAAVVLFLLLIGFCIHTYRFMYRVPRTLEAIEKHLRKAHAENNP